MNIDMEQEFKKAIDRQTGLLEIARSKNIDIEYHEKMLADIKALHEKWRKENQ